MKVRRLNEPSERLEFPAGIVLEWRIILDCEIAVSAVVGCAVSSWGDREVGFPTMKLHGFRELTLAASNSSFFKFRGMGFAC